MRITDIKLDPTITQKSKKGKIFRVTSVAMNLQYPPKWWKENGVNVEHFYWDVDVNLENDKKMRFTFDYYGELTGKEEI